MAALAFFYLRCGGFVDVGVLVGAQKYFLAACHVGVTAYTAVVHGVGHFALGSGGKKTAGLLGGKEELPRLFCEGVGEHFNIVAAAGGIHNLVHVAFFLEEELLVAGYALAEGVGGAVGGIEGSGDDGVHAGHACRERLGLAAQEIDVSVVDGLVEARGEGAYVHLGAGEVGGFVLLDNLCPQQAGGTEFGDFHEEVARYTHIEFYA